MKLARLLFILPLAIYLLSCAPSVSRTFIKKYAPLDYKERVIVYGLNYQEPSNAEILGQIKIGDTGLTTDCSYKTVIEKAIFEARKIGGNVIKITEHQTPDFWSSCHRITAKILKVHHNLNSP